MRTFVTLLLLVPATAACGQHLDYPESRRVAHVDTYHGTDVADPYRWMEALDSEELAEWMRAQDALTTGWLESERYVPAVANRIQAMRRYDFEGVPVRRGEYVFVSRRLADQGFGGVFVQRDGEEERLLLDLESARARDEHSFLNGTSRDGRLSVLFTSQGPTRWKTVRVLGTESGEYLAEEMTGFYSGQSTVTWDYDGTGFYYTRYDVPENPQAPLGKPRVFYHTLGEPQSADDLVFEQRDGSDLSLTHQLTSDGRFLVIEGSSSGGTFDGLYDRVFVKALPSGAVEEWFAGDDGSHAFEARFGNMFVFRTTDGAPNGRLIAGNGSGSWRTFVSEEEWPMQRVAAFRDHMLIHYLRDTQSLLRTVDASGEPVSELTYPTTNVFGLADDHFSDVAHYGVSTMTAPSFIHQMDLRTGEAETTYRPNLPYDAEAYQTELTFAESADGTRIPVSLVYHRDFERDGSAPVFMYGYGAWAWAAFPWQQYMMPWLEIGGVYAIAHIRGGGEYGAAWHHAGIGANKERGIEDYVAAAEHLVSANYTSADRLVANGGSASGMLPAIAINRRPDLFGAAVIDYPALDMLRLKDFGNGASWLPEFGDPADPDAFELLAGYSPYHNLEARVCYPPVFVQVGDHDDTTTPMHGYKYVAAMQHAQGCDNPVLLKIAWGAGHSAGKTPEDSRRTQAEEIAFMIKALGLKRPNVEELASGRDD